MNPENEKTIEYFKVFSRRLSQYSQIDNKVLGENVFETKIKLYQKDQEAIDAARANAFVSGKPFINQGKEEMITEPDEGIIDNLLQREIDFIFND